MQREISKLHVLNREYKILLPRWVYRSNSTSEINRKAARYMQRYDNYEFIRVAGDFAVCLRKE